MNPLFLSICLFVVGVTLIGMTLAMRDATKEEAAAQLLLKEVRSRLEEAQDELADLDTATAFPDVRLFLHRVGADKECDHECELVAVVANDKDEEYEVRFVALMTREEVEDLHGQLGRFLDKGKA